MKDYLTYLKESIVPQWQGSTFHFVFGSQGEYHSGIEFAKYHDIETEYEHHIPLSKSLFNKLKIYTNKIIGYHVTNLEGLEQLIKIQKSKKSISCVSNISYDFFYGGVWNSGFACKVKGDQLAGSNEDMMSQPDKSGRRWLAVDYPFGIKDRLPEFFYTVKAIKKDLFVKWYKKYKNESGDNITIENDWNSLGYFIRERTFNTVRWGDIRLTKEEGQQQIGRFLNKMIKDYLDEVERVFKNNKDLLHALSIIVLAEPQRKQFGSFDWDEYVINNFEIDKNILWSSNNSNNYIGNDSIKILEKKYKQFNFWQIDNKEDFINQTNFLNYNKFKK